MFPALHNSQGIEKSNIDLLRCIKCQGNFKYREFTINFALLSCFCNTYPLVEGILYLHNSNLRKNSLHHLWKRDFQQATKTLLGSRRIILFFLAFFLFPNVINSLIKTLLNRNIYQLLGFENVVKIITPLVYDKPWAWYIMNRKKMPYYFTSLATTNVLMDYKAKVIDVGCGTGQLLHSLSQKIKPQNIFGIDNSFLTLLLARRFFASPNTLLICTDIEKGLPFKERSIDFVLSTDSFHYLS